MTLENNKLEQLLTEMNELLSERMDELSRTRADEHADDKADLDSLVAEISGWKAKASKVPANPDVDSEKKKLELEAREICSRIQVIGRP